MKLAGSRPPLVTSDKGAESREERGRTRGHARGRVCWRMGAGASIGVGAGLCAGAGADGTQFRVLVT